MTAEEIRIILDKHSKWLYKLEGGERANFEGADLRMADLHGINLYMVNLHGANLFCADLSDTILCGADLSDANLSIANLYGADLCGANLCGANLCHANLRKAELRGANFYRTYLDEVQIETETLDKFFPICCPEHGSFIGWKKCRCNKIVKLEICEDAKRSSAFGRKCRCSTAKVIAIEDIYGNSIGGEAISAYDGNFIYHVGEVIFVDNFDEDRRNECAAGIHFFITRREAVEYIL